MKKIIVLICLLFITLLAKDNSKYLKSEIRAEVKAEKLIDGGYYNEAKDFLKKATSKYSNNASLYAYYGKVFYQLGDLETAKLQFLLSLKIDPTNELSSGFVKLINEQEAASVNENIQNTLDYLSDKGFDFIMIFLAFLGGEVIAKRYSRCANVQEKNALIIYISDVNYISKKFQFYIKNIFLNPVCSFLSMLIIMINSFAFSILILWLELSEYIPILFLNYDINTLTSTDVLNLIVFNFITIASLFIIYGIYKKSSELDIDENDISDKLQSLALNHEYGELREYLMLFNENNKKLNKVLDCFISDEAREITEKINNKILKGK